MLVKRTSAGDWLFMIPTKMTIKDIKIKKKIFKYHHFAYSVEQVSIKQFEILCIVFYMIASVRWYREIRLVKIFTVVGHRSGTVAIDVHFHFEHAVCH